MGMRLLDIPRSKRRSPCSRLVDSSKGQMLLLVVEGGVESPEIWKTPQRRLRKATPSPAIKGKGTKLLKVVVVRSRDETLRE